MLANKQKGLYYIDNESAEKIIHPISGKNKKIAEKAAGLIARDYGEVICKLANV